MKSHYVECWMNDILCLSCKSVGFSMIVFVCWFHLFFNSFASVRPMPINVMCTKLWTCGNFSRFRFGLGFEFAFILILFYMLVGWLFGSSVVWLAALDNIDDCDCVCHSSPPQTPTTSPAPSGSGLSFLVLLCRTHFAFDLCSIPFLNNK